MTTLSRTYSASYGSLTIGGISTKYILYGPVQRSAAYGVETFAMLVIVKSTGAVALETDCQALIDLIRVPRQDLVIVQGSQTTTYTEDTNCISITASLARSPGTFDSHLTRAFNLSFTVVRNADDDSDNGLLDYSFSESIGTNGVRVIAVEASFTQHDGDTAEQVYTTLFADLLDDIKVRVEADTSIEWEESLRTVNYDRFNQTLKVVTSLTERIFGEQADGSFDNSIKDQVIFLSLMEKPTAGLEAASTTVPQLYMVMYACTVDKTFTQDLYSVYNTISRPAILAYVTEVSKDAGASTSRGIQYVSDNVSLDPVNNSIKAELAFRIYGTSPIFQASASFGYRFKPPVQKIPTYELNGFGRLRLPGIGSCQYITKTSVTKIGDISGALDAARNLIVKPTRTSFGGTFRAVNNAPLSRQQYNDAGVDGAGWTFETEEYDYEGPFYDDGDPPVTYSVASVVQRWDLDVDPTNIDGGSLERGS